MALPVSSISSGVPTPLPNGSSGVSRPGHDLPFADMVKNLIAEANSQQAEVGAGIRDLVTGETDSIHDVVLTASQADLAFRLVMEIRDRLIASYQEVMRMQV
ncbi:MAG: flagellar hook-basal body complex protein FliE [Planctomycetaceae bacterium]|nr:flagellar hook-basal body complex protein FliE [Planctomycetaceae bacterium]